MCPLNVLSVLAQLANLPALSYLDLENNEIAAAPPVLVAALRNGTMQVTIRIQIDMSPMCVIPFLCGAVGNALLKPPWRWPVWRSPGRGTLPLLPCCPAAMIAFSLGLGFCIQALSAAVGALCMGNGCGTVCAVEGPPQGIVDLAANSTVRFQIQIFLLLQRRR